MMNKKSNIIFKIIVVVSILVFGITLAQKTLQNDTFYTIKIGEHIVETKSIDMKDPFSWHENLTYTYPHWLYDTSIYLIYNAGENIANHFNQNAEQGGMTAIYISTMLFATIMGALIYITNEKISNNKVISLLLTLGSMYLLRNFIAARAQLVSYSLFVLEILFIEQFLRKPKKRYIIGLFAVATLIANLHAAVWYMFFILALPYIGEAVVIWFMESNLSARIELRFLANKIKKKEKKLEKVPESKVEKINSEIEKLKKKEQDLLGYKERCTVAVQKMEKNSKKINYIKRKNIKLLVLVLILCAFSGLLTPQTSYEPYTHFFKLLKGNSTASISEHLPIVLAESVDAMLVLVILGALLIFTDAKISLKDLFMLGGLIILTLMSRRQISILALVGVYSLNIIITELINKYEPEGIDKKLIKPLTTPYAILVITLLLVLCGISFFGTKYKDDFVDKSSYPVDAAQYILDNVDIKNMKLFNHYNFGSYLLYKNIPVIIDSRCDLYTPEFNGQDIFSDVLNISGLSMYYEDGFEKYGITHVITYTDGNLNKLLEHDDKYEELYRDDYFCLYKRNV